MPLIKGNGGKSFAPHPQSESFIRAVIVDITELTTMQTKYGDKEVFKIVYETEFVDDDGRHGMLWSPPYTPSLNEKASFRRDLKKIRGADVTPAEMRELDVEKVLLGFPVKILVSHEHVGDRTFAKISEIRPDQGPNPYKPSGEYVRRKDRQEGGGSTYRKAASAPEADNADDQESNEWGDCKVHVGKYENIALKELDSTAVLNLHDKWIPTLEGKKPTAADKRLRDALLEAKKAYEAMWKSDAIETQPF